MIRRCLAWLLLALTVFPPPVWGAAYNTRGSGNWSATSTWTTGACGGGEAPAVPGDGDTVTICASHTVTVDANTTVGTDATYVLNMTTTGAGLVINAPLTVKGGLRFSGQNATITGNPGGALTLASNTAQANIWAQGDTTGRQVSFTGASYPAAPFVITGTAAGASKSQFSDASTTAAGAPLWYFRNVKITGLGSASVTAGTVLKRVDWDYVLLDGSGYFDLGNINDDVIFDVNHLDVRNPLAATSIRYRNSSDIGVQVRRLRNSTFSGSGATTFLHATDLTVSDVVSEGPIWPTNGSFPTQAKRQRWTRVTFVSSGAGSSTYVQTPIHADMRFDQVAILRYFAAAGTNAHDFWDLGTASGGTDFAIAPNQLTNSFIDGFQNRNTGDVISNGGAWIVDGNIAIRRFGCLTNGYNGDTGAVQGRHNTIVDATNTSHYGAFVIAELLPDVDKIADLRCNLFVNTAHGVTQLGQTANTGVFTRQTGFTLDYNGFSGITFAGNFRHAALGVNSYLDRPRSSAILSEAAAAGTDQDTVKLSSTAGMQAGDVVYKWNINEDGSGAAVIASVDDGTTLTLGASLDTVGVTGIVGLTNGNTVRVEKGYWSAGAYGDDGKGQHDISADPTFVDDTRTAQTWDASLGGAGTAANILAEMLKLNGVAADGSAAAFNSNYTVSNLLNYIRAGFAPQAAAYNSACAYDGGDIGAVDVLLSGAPPRRIVVMD